jgi:hypothetical protein
MGHLEGTDLLRLLLSGYSLHRGIAAADPASSRASAPRHSTSTFGWLAAFNTPKPRILGPLLWLIVDSADYLRISRL